MMVGLCVTISLTLHAKKIIPSFVLTAQELAQSTKQTLLKRELLVWNNAQASVCISRGIEGFQLIPVKTKQRDTLHWDYELPLIHH